MRFRKDVKDGDLVIKNRGGWYVPLVVSSQPVGEVVSVYESGNRIPFGIVHHHEKGLETICEVKLH